MEAEARVTADHLKRIAHAEERTHGVVSYCTNARIAEKATEILRSQGYLVFYKTNGSGLYQFTITNNLQETINERGHSTHMESIGDIRKFTFSKL